MQGWRTFTVVALLIGTVAGAGTVRPASADARDISVGGVWITRITHDWGGYTAEQRATEITKRITRILGTTELRQGAVITIGKDGPNALVTVGTILVFTVTPADAAGSGTTTYVARQWAALLAQGLSKALPGSNFHGF
ncbi:MAG TPA: hypothetical protein VGX97_05480 [bacterium]|nr:hypothetical protein [bacterium]